MAREAQGPRHRDARSRRPPRAPHGGRRPRRRTRRALGARGSERVASASAHARAAADAMRGARRKKNRASRGRIGADAWRFRHVPAGAAPRRGAWRRIRGGGRRTAARNCRGRRTIDRRTRRPSTPIAVGSRRRRRGDGVPSSAGRVGRRSRRGDGAAAVYDRRRSRASGAVLVRRRRRAIGRRRLRDARAVANGQATRRRRLAAHCAGVVEAALRQPHSR